MCADPLREILEVAERVSIAGDEFALAVLDVGEGAKAIDLQLENNWSESKGSERRESRIGRILRGNTQEL